MIDGPAVTAVLWDIDGTLLSSGGVAARAFLDAVEEVAGRRPEGRGLDLGGRIDPEIAVTLLASVDADEGLAPHVLARLHDNAMARTDEFHDKVRPLPGVAATLARLDLAGVRQTVVTGNIESVGRLKLLAGGLIPPIDPDLGGYGDSGTTRVEVARSALARLVAAGWQQSADQCWIIGDTPRDLACARALGVRCALVGTGMHPAASMAGLGADIVLDSLDTADDLFAGWIPAAAE